MAVLKRRIATAIACALLATACSLGPDYERPQTQAPTAWLTPTDGDGVWPDARWWQGFGSPELDRLIEAAIASNYDLAAAALRIRQAEAQARIAGAAFYPSLSADTGASRSWSDASGSSRTILLDDGTTVARGSGSGRVSTTTYQSSLQVGYQFDLFGGNQAALDAALERLQGSRYDRETVAITLHAEVARTYFQLLSLNDRGRLAQETLQIAEDVLAVLQSQRRAGASSDLEVAQQRSAVASQRSALVGLELAARQTRNALAILLGRNPDALAVQGQSLEALDLPGIAAGLPSELLQRRPDIRRTEAELRAASRDTVAARAARFPSIDLSARASLQSTALSDLLDSSGLVYSLAGSLVAPIFQGGRLQAQEDLSAARFQELAQSYRLAVVTAFREVEDALSAADISDRQFALAREAFDQAREAFRIVEARFRAGTVDFLNVLDAQRTVFQANDALVQAALLRFTSAVDLYLALGGGWDGSTGPPVPNSG